MSPSPALSSMSLARRASPGATGVPYRRGSSTPKLLPPRVSSAAWTGSTSKRAPRDVPVVFDGAHVPFNLAAVLRDLARFSDLAGPCVAVVALASDKDAAGFLRELKRRASAVVFTEPHAASRGRPASELAALAGALGLRSEVEPEPERAFRRGLELAGEAKSWLLVTGSLYLVGALRRAAAHRAR